ncbi:MAG: ketosteroid isomerase-like protein [Candidatus Azotimanducaceae bacterium]|jgi:ketosteroid isomerase-like protein
MLLCNCYVYSHWIKSINMPMISAVKRPTGNASGVRCMPRIFCAFACLMLLVLASCSTLQDSQRSRNIAMAEDFFDKFVVDPYTAQDLLHPEFSFVYKGHLPISNVDYDRDTFFSDWLQLVGSLAPKGIVFETVGTIADDHGVALIKTGDGEGINGEYDNAYVFIFKMVDDKIHSLEEYNSDLLTATRLYSNKLVPSN